MSPSEDDCTACYTGGPDDEHSCEGDETPNALPYERPVGPPLDSISYADIDGWTE